MNSSTGRWVSGDDFFNRDRELQILETLVRDRNHVLLTGQRRMGKTTIVRELGRRLEADGWIFLFADVEGADSPEQAVADIARAVHQIRSIASRFAVGLKRIFSERIEEISAPEFSLKIRAVLNDGNWRRHGDELFGACAEQDKPVLLVVDGTTHLSQTHAPSRRQRTTCGRIPELVTRRVPGARRRLSGPHCVRQYRSRTTRPTAQHTRSHQLFLYLPARTMGP